mgnify:CR=1 FL=1
MQNIWHSISPDRIQPEDFIAIIEIEKGSKRKYELDKETGLLVLDRRALRSVDFGLLLTFVCFFVFAGNMARIPSVEAVLSQAMADNALLASAAASQIVSNVPAAVLLSHFTDSYQALLVGVNIGGAGTLVASLASLITFNQYRAVCAALGRRPELARQTASGFVARFTAFNFAFLAVLYAVCAVCG